MHFSNSLHSLSFEDLAGGHKSGPESLEKNNLLSMLSIEPHFVESKIHSLVNTLAFTDSFFKVFKYENWSHITFEIIPFVITGQNIIHLIKIKLISKIKSAI
jgi:hypothetical protein